MVSATTPLSALRSSSRVSISLTTINTRVDSVKSGPTASYPTSSSAANRSRQSPSAERLGATGTFPDFANFGPTGLSPGKSSSLPLEAAYSARAQSRSSSFACSNAKRVQPYIFLASESIVLSPGDVLPYAESGRVAKESICRGLR